MQLISTVPCHQTDQLVPDSVVKSGQAFPVEPGFAQHCVTATLVRPDCSQKTVSVLRDTGALQSLVCSRVLSDQDYLPIDECRLIRGVTGDVVSVPLVEITLRSPYCGGTHLCGLVSTLPTGVAILLSNDLCPDPPTLDVNVVTRSQTAALRKQAEVVSNATIASVADDSPADDIVSNSVAASVADDSSSELESGDDTVSDPVVDVSSLFEESSKSSSLLFVLCSPQEATFHQIVVPTPLRSNLLSLAHETPAAGHLGVAKTKDRLLRHFYWPSVSRDTRNFCRSCDVCQ